ncbi:MAG: AI-2E family transporter [Saprospiraceae bacterium]|nr:AI-2E family transporter [Saprospiraceae bacterium]
MNKISSIQFFNSERGTLLNYLITIILLFVVLQYGKILFIPLSCALLIGFLLYPPVKKMEEKGLNSILAIFICLLGIMVIFVAVLFLIFTQIYMLKEEWPGFMSGINSLIENISLFLSSSFNITDAKQTQWLNTFFENSGAHVFNFIQNLYHSISNILILLILIPIFSGLVLYYRRLLTTVLFNFFEGELKEQIKSILTDSIHVYYKFIKGVLFVYFIVGCLNSIGLAIFNIPNAILFGFTAAVLTFIPYIGITLASLLPLYLAWSTHQTVWQPLSVLLVFAIVQFLEGYVIFPLAVSNRLRINPLITIISAIVGGLLWGAIGMIIFIPMVGILKLISERFKKLNNLSLLMGTDIPSSESTAKTDTL